MREMTVDEVERAAVAKTYPATPLHAGTPYVKGPARDTDVGEPRHSPAPDFMVPVFYGAMKEKPDGTFEHVSLGRLRADGLAPPPLSLRVRPGKPTTIGLDLGHEGPCTAAANPKALVGKTKVPMLSVIPETALVKMARALQYGAFFAPRKDREEKGYGPKNWRDDRIPYMTYVDAAQRHLLCAADREDIDPDTGDLRVGHLEEAMATIAILIDAIEHGTCDDNRPKSARGLVAQMLRNMREEL